MTHATHAGDIDDFTSAGMIGLIQAADRFDPTRGVSFALWAERRIRGAILDDFRIGDTYSRRERELRKNPEYADSTRAAQVHGQRDDSFELWRVVCRRSDDLRTSRDTLIVLAAMLPRLPYRLRCIMRMYYFEDKVDTEIARVYKVTASRICQMRRESEALLRKEADRLGVELNDFL